MCESRHRDENIDTCMFENFGNVGNNIRFRADGEIHISCVNLHIITYYVIIFNASRDRQCDMNRN